MSPEEAGVIFRVETVRLCDLDADVYQRAHTAQARAKGLLKQWDRRKCMPLVVGRRKDGSLWCVDGLARKIALERQGITASSCMVFDSAGRAQESVIFWAVNGGTTKTTQLQTFVAQVMGADERATDIRSLVADAGFAIESLDEPAPGQATTQAVTALQDVYACGRDHLIATLALCRDTWPRDRKSGASLIIKGVSTFLIAHESRVDAEQFKDALGARSVEDVLAKYGQLKSVIVTGDSKKFLYLAILGFYNSGLREPKRLGNHSERLGPMIREFKRRNQATRTPPAQSDPSVVHQPCRRVVSSRSAAPCHPTLL